MLRNRLSWRKGAAALELLAVLGIGIAAADVRAATITLSASNGNVLDDVELKYVDNVGTPWTTNAGTEGNMAGPEGLIGFKDLFTTVPLTSGGNPISIDSASLKVTTNTGAGNTLSLYRVTNDWLTYAPGQSQLQVNGHFRDIANGLTWNTTPTWNTTFGTADYDAASVSTGTITDGNYNGTNTIDVTAAVRALFNSGVNQGWYAVLSGTNGALYIRAQENGTGQGPELTINYSYAAVPEPATVGLLASVGGLLVLRRRRVAR